MILGLLKVVGELENIIDILQMAQKMVISHARKQTYHL